MNKSIALIIGFLLVAITAISQESLFVITQNTGFVPEKVDSAVVAKVNVTANLSLLKLENINSVLVLLPDTQTVVINRKKVQYDKLNRFSWYGEINNQPGSLVIFSITNNKMAGFIRSNSGFVYQINYKGDSVYQIRKINPSLIREVPDNIPLSLPDQDTSHFTEPYCTDSPAWIDIMVVYSSPVAAATGGLDDMVSQIGLFVDITNTSYLRSNISQRVQLVHVSEIPYIETENPETDLRNLITDGDNIMDDVHDWRNTHHADIVVLIVENNTLDGFAKVMTTVSVNFENLAFCLVKRSRAGFPVLAFPHELGHIMGARHDCTRAHQESDPSDPNLPFSFAHGFDGLTWRTMMSTNINLTKQDLWSNPLIPNPYNGDDMGNSNVQCGANNALTLNTTAATVSRFRCRPPLITNVWMKDTWEDTGVEPDPNTVGQLMCMSPYIWVRNIRDIGFIHQHDHQNPVAGAPNFIYVKLHNGGPTITGNLEVYIASASTSLTWPIHWTLIATRSITLNNLTTSIIEFNWNTQSNVGHYCLLARWVAATDPMAVAETADINANTRQNNNIIWRNMNIIDLDLSPLSSTVFEIERQTENAMMLEFSDSALFPDEPFYKEGRVTIILDKLTFHAWKQGGSVYSGLKRDGREFRITSPNAFIANILLAPKHKGKIRMEFQKKKETKKDKYFFVAAQYEQEVIRKATEKKAAEKKANRKFIGAVGYEIYTYKKR